MSIGISNLTNANNDAIKVFPESIVVHHPQSTPIKSNEDKITISNTTKNEKVGGWEALKLIGKGFKDKIVDIGKNIIQHPIKTIAAMALTTGALMALPFIGISMASGAAILTLGFGLAALFGTLKNSIKALKYSYNGENNKVREQLYKLGGNGVDLALTVPFLPKAMKQLNVNMVKNHGNILSITKNADGKVIGQVKKYFGGTKEISFNPDGTILKINKNSLYNQIKNAKTLKEKFATLFKQDSTEKIFMKLNDAYKKTAKERGFLRPHDIQTTVKPIKTTIGTNSNTTGMTTGFVQTHNPHIVNINRTTLNRYGLRKICETIGHEHRHVEQNSMMARTEGLTKIFDKFYALRAHKDGIIKQGTEQATLAKKFYNALRNYVAPEKDRTTYLNNLLEVDAREVGGKIIGAQIWENLKKLTKMSTPETLIAQKYNPVVDLVTSNAMVVNKTV